MDMPGALRAVTERRNLSADEMRAVMRLIMTGQATPAQIGGFLVGLRMKGETVDEITAAVQVMRELVTPVNVAADKLVDIVGTGGDGAHTFNISTASAFVVAAAGGRVAKHGNRSVSSQSGSADVLEAAGVNINLTPEQVARCVNEVGVGFMFAPLHHSAMKHAIGPRREMGVRTIFNLLGPLTNPAGALNQLIGVYSAQWVEPVAQVLAKLGSKHVMVVHSDDGMDEISMAAPTQVAELKDGKVSTYSISPEQFGIARSDKTQLMVKNAQESLGKVRAVLNNAAGSDRDIVALNAGAASYVAGLAPSLNDGVKLAQHVIASGAARDKLSDLVTLSNSFVVNK
ncbi:MAG: anthranilate phosphoribosyltransferase [Gammaproteobacteria bacterium]|nr:anthranilate phosphoribosyltransferase [Gammaproteobacteria bacterium]